MVGMLRRIRVSNNIFNHNINAVIGIGAMIVFIALVLCAGMAASVLIQTAGNLESKAMSSGRETTTDVSTGLKITNIEGKQTTRWMRYNRSTEAPFAIDGYYGDADETWLGHYNYTRIHNITLSITPTAGTSEIDISELIIEISNSSTKCILKYSSSEFASSVPANGLFDSQAFDLRPDQFGVIEIEDADNSCDSTNPVINRGDRIMITINASACFFGLPPRDYVRGSIYPENGAFTSFKFYVPSVINDSVYDMYPKD